MMFESQHFHNNVQFCSCSFSGDFQPEDSLDGQVSEEACLFIFHIHHEWLML